MKRLVILVIISGILFGLDQWGKLNWVRQITEPAVRPVRRVGYKLRLEGGATAEWLKLLKTGRARIADLERRVQELEVKAAKAEVLEKENASLREAKKVGVLLKPAEVVGMSEIILLAISQAAGAVVTETGVLAGEVIESGKFITKVRPLTHPETKIKAKTLNGASGVIMGTGRGVKLTEVLQSENLAVGDRVVTAGSEMMPANLLIGKVNKIEAKPAAVYQEAEIEAFYLTGQLKYLYLHD